MATSRLKNKGRKNSGNFAALPHILMDHPDFKELSSCALRILLWLLRQYNGRNNGDLSATLSQVKRHGVKSSASLTKATAELQQRNLVVKTREGMFTNPGGRCSLYALAWQPIDECRGRDLEICATTTPPRKLSLENLGAKPGT
jgi:hypothetical protein